MTQRPEFLLIYFRNLSKFDTYELAYEASEDQFFKQYGRRKYKNYVCFKTVFSRSMKK